MRSCALVVACALVSAPMVAGAESFPAAVAADHPRASRAGAEMLEKGGNAVDAAVAAAMTLSVVEPYACGIGGGGFMLVALTDDPRTAEPDDPMRLVIDFRETAPAAVGEGYFAELPVRASRDGGTSVGVPGTVAGLLSALERFGTLDRETVLAPAIRAAEDGFAVTPDYAKTVEEGRRFYRSDVARQERFAFVWDELMGRGELAEGAQLRNPGQAQVLRRVVEHGAAGFYEGPVAAAIVEAVQEDGGVLSAEDLSGYAPVDREPVVASFAGYTLVVAPPPSSGGVATLEILGLLERYAAKTGTPLGEMEHNSVAYMHALSEAFKHAFADRNAVMGDADFANVPWRGLISEEHLDALAARMDPEHTLGRADEYGGPGLEKAALPDDAGTSHLSIVDRDGNAVACTLTINTDFGSKLSVPGFGFVLNNEMDDFTTRPGRTNAFGLKQSAANAPAPGKRPLSSMSPTIVFFSDGDVELVVGASGGPRIITATVQVILNTLIFGMEAPAAVTEPRVHDQLWPPALQLEPEWDLTMRIDPEDVEAVQRWMRDSKRNEKMRFALTSLGHPLRRMERIGNVQAVRRTDTGYEPASDPRKGGVPAGVR